MQEIIETKTNNKEYSDERLEGFKKNILNIIKKHQETISNLTNHVGPENTVSVDEKNSETTDEELHSVVKNKQTIILLKEKVRDLENALKRIENKTYGTCRLTGKLINPARLDLIPEVRFDIPPKRN